MHTIIHIITPILRFSPAIPSELAVKQADNDRVCPLRIALSRIGLGLTTLHPVFPICNMNLSKLRHLCAINLDNSHRIFIIHSFLLPPHLFSTELFVEVSKPLTFLLFF